MLYIPVNEKTPAIGLHETVMRGIAPDGSLYLPESLPSIPRAFFNNISAMSLPEIGYVVANMFFGSDIPSVKIKELVEKAINFEIPFEETEPNRFTLDLTQGPTNNYNDISARFMASYVEIIRRNEPTNIVVVTSDNVGNAVADAFSTLNDVNTFVVYPTGSLSDCRRSNLLDYGSQVVPIEVAGSFHECQNLVKDVILSSQNKSEIPLLTANSVNIAILLPRVIYFFYAYARLAALDRPIDKVVIATPTENLGNATAAVIASKMGLPVKRFMAILTNDLDASDITNESRLRALLKNNPNKIDLELPSDKAIADDEIVITLKTDDPSRCIFKPHPKGHSQKVTHIALSATALNKVINEHNKPL
ncbi:MAG: hypothetical protein K2H32_06145 [Muribaculaceae bacterium]|nr:hypothetical protein [Muribaculaceae bacterium]MDE7369560.1 hypothetical protein [Muribaculaceae bacterium]